MTFALSFFFAGWQITSVSSSQPAVSAGSREPADVT
jgi:hypothetical protein